ncbi:MAG: hypothetical protein IH585_03650 [Anaerolineaceae bacterium]|nr:hypothetical protein [Anaerolineaceae bacterium]
MDKLDDNHYQLILPVRVPSLVKYRFYKNNGLPIYETNSENQVIEYRMAYINSPTIINNKLINWTDEQYAYNYGRISGQAINSETNSPIPNALIVVGGIHSYTNSLGNFVIENLPAGKHNLTIMSTDGEYQTFQQEAIVGEGLTTPAIIGMQATKFVNISFIVKPPEGTPDQAPIRILGNTYQLGNVFGNIYNGTSIAPARAPKLTTLPDGSYTITMSLPSGYDLRYKYSLGDGFWNAELNSENNFVVRQIIVPDKDTIINDFIQSWNSTDTQGVEIIVNVPENTPDTDKVSIQFNSFGWSPPIQMWQTDAYQWTYRLFGPYHLVSKIDYRICRNDACGSADDGSAPVNGYSFDTASLPQTLNVNVAQWKGWNQEIEAPSLIAPEVINRGSNFVAGFSFSDNYNVNTPLYVETAYKNILGVNGNTIVIPIKWTLQSLKPVILSPITGNNPLWKDLVLMIQKAQNQGLKVWLSPEIELSPLAVKQFLQEDLSSNWQLNLSSSYGEFIIFSADLANYMNIEGIIYPTDIQHLYNFENYATLSEIMVDATNANIENIKGRFANKLFISLNSSQFTNETLLSSVDGFVITPKIDFVESTYVREDYQTTFKAYLEEEVFTNYSRFGKLIFIGLNFPSVKGVERGCVISEETCFDFDIINNLELSSLNTSFEIDLLSQVDLNNAAFNAINETEWVNGIVSQEFNPQVAIMDSTSSVRGKPAIGVFWYWFPRMMGINN